MSKFNFDDVIGKIKEDDKNKFDEMVEFNKLKLNSDGEIGFFPEEMSKESKIHGMKMTDWAESQMCGWLGIPHRYYKKCPNDMKRLNANHWFERAASSKVRLRCKSNTIRGVLSDKYTPISNFIVNDIIGNGVGDKKVSIEDFNLSDHSFHLRLTFNDLQLDIGKTKEGKADTIKGGIHIVNSEVGASSVRIYSVVYRQICTNGLMGFAEDEEFNQRHIYITVNELKSRAIEAIEKAIGTSSEALNKMAKAKKEYIEDPVKDIIRITENRFSNKFTEKVIEAYRQETDRSRYGLVNSFTRASRDLDYDSRVEVEKFAGSLLG